MTNLVSVVEQLKKEREQASKTVERLDAALAALGEVSGRKTANRSRLSAAARARIAAAQRARWAKARAKAGRQEQNVVSISRKKTLSPAARRKIAAAQKARWAKIKAAQKKTA
jgi:hypothetical protein